MRNPETDGPLTQRSLRVANARRILEAIREAGPVPRTRIAAMTGLTLTTAHRLVADLRARGLVVHAPSDLRMSETGPGRPAPAFAFNAEAGLIAGIDVGNETTRSGLADLRGTLLVREEQPTAEIEPDLVGSLTAMVERLLAANGRTPDSLIAVGVGVPAVVQDEDRIVRTSLRRPWEGLALGSGLSANLGTPSIIAQDDHLAALAELRRGVCVGRSAALVLNIGKGIGASVIVEGEVYRGARHAAGRVGRVPVDVPDGRLPLSRLLTADGLIDDYLREGGAAAPAGARDVFAADSAGDLAATTAVDRFADRLGVLIATLAATIDPELVVIGGGIGAAFDRLAPGVRDVVERALPDPPEIVPSPLGVDAGVLGAVEGALARADTWFLERIAEEASITLTAT